MVVMATSTSDVVKKVTRLKSQLRDPAEPKTIIKTLQKLKDLDMTLEVLIETGIGKTVNSLRKHKQAGELAKSLVTYWKKLVPKDSTSHTAEGENTLSSDLNAKTRDQNCQENGSFLDKPNDGVSNCNANSQDGSNEVKHKAKALSVSFESFLSYDYPHKKKDQHGRRKPQKKNKPVKKDESSKELCTKKIKLPTMSENDFTSKKAKGFEMDLLPLPAHLPEIYHKPSTVVDYFERKLCPSAEKITEEDTSNSIGQRLNKRMQVYSGSKSNFLPTMMSLYQQCVRTLQNNIDILFETGGVPFDIMEPVLERCTPNQLLRIEECNPVYIGETDHLWEKHCQREFRDSKLQEYESWKEMYIRLSEERERKFKKLTKSIVSAHSTKPKGRQVKMAFIHTVAKPPRNVRLQQEIHRSKSGSKSASLKLPVKSSDSSPKNVIMNTTKATIERSYNEQYKNEQYKSGTSSSGTSNAQDPRKKTRVAPMMAKSLKAFKNHLGRR